MEQTDSTLKLPMIQSETVESNPKSNDAPQSNLKNEESNSNPVLKEESKPQLTNAAKEKLSKEIEAAKERKSEQSSREAAAKVKQRKPSVPAEVKNPVGRPKKEVVEEESLQFEQGEIEDALEIFSVLLKKFKLEELDSRERKQVAKPLTKIVNKTLAAKYKKYSDEAQLAMAVGGIIIARLPIGKQNTGGVRNEGEGKNDAPSRVYTIGKEVAGS
jgi:hypothetical protein